MLGGYSGKAHLCMNGILTSEMFNPSTIKIDDICVTK